MAKSSSRKTRGKTAVRKRRPAAAKRSTARRKPTRPKLLGKWVGPYGGVPAFEKVKVKELKPAIEAAMDEKRREVHAIAQQRAAPTFQNTLAALENSGRSLERVLTYFW